MKSYFLYALVLLLSVTACQNSSNQAEFDRRKSPIAIAKLNHADTYIKIVYGQPYKRGRDIFGELEAYGEVWRTGANEATELTTTRDILFAGNHLDAGTYALFTIPGKDRWTIILNSQLGQWGAFEYDSDFDVLRVDVDRIKKKDITEAFTIQFDEVKNDSTSIIMEWDTTQVKIPIEFTTQESSTGDTSS